jgi:hypothetical protein
MGAQPCTFTPERKNQVFTFFVDPLRDRQRPQRLLLSETSIVDE